MTKNASPIRGRKRHPTRYVAFKPQCTNEFQELPHAIVLTVNDAIVSRIANLRALCKRHDLDEVRVTGVFHTVSNEAVVPETLADRLEDEEEIELSAAEAKQLLDLPEMQGIRGDKLVVTENYFWLTCYDKYTDAVIETTLLDLDTFLGVPRQQVA